MSVPAVMQSAEGEGLSREARQSPGDRAGALGGRGAMVRTGSWTSRKPPPARGLCVKSGRSAAGAPGAEDCMSGRGGPGLLPCPGGSVSPGSPQARVPAAHGLEVEGWEASAAVPAGPPLRPRLPAAGEHLSPPRPGRSH